MKTLQDVIDELNSIVEANPFLADCPVYVIADHGQTYIEMREVTLDYTMEYHHSMDEAVNLEEVEAFELNKVKPFITIGD